MSAGLKTPGEYVLLQMELPGQSRRNIGVILVDPATEEFRLRLTDNWADCAEDDTEVLCNLEDHLNRVARESGCLGLLEFLESTLSNTVLVSERQQTMVSDLDNALDKLFQEHVQRRKRATVAYLPVVSFRAAATKFGEDMEIDEIGRVEAPSGLRVTPEMFVAQVVGRSMEPLIPDGSLCIFRGNVTGSRQGKRVLVWQRATSATSGEYTVKEYHSVKSGQTSLEGAEWRHESIVLKPLNREFEELRFQPEDEGEKFRVVAEFVRVLRSGYE